MAVKTTASLEVGRRLRQLRENRGIPKERVALELGMSAENFRHYESGRNQLAVTMLPTLAELYGMTVAELVTELFDLCPPGHILSSSVNGSPIKDTTNYNYTEPRNQDFGSLAPIRELTAAGR